MTMLAPVLFLGLALVASLLLLLPLLRARKLPDRQSFDLTVYQDQLAELERDLERGLIDPEEAKAARVEIERRILATAREAGPETTEGGGERRWLMPTALALGVPLLSALIYLQIGAPTLPDQPLAARKIAPGGDPGTGLAGQIEQHLEETPDNGDIWLMLGRARLQAGDAPGAVEALAEAVRLTPDNAMVAAELGEVMTYAAGGTVTPDAVERFKAALELAPNEPRARYYLGLALAQSGATDEALDAWRGLLEVNPSDAPWRQQVIEAIRSMLAEAGRDPEPVLSELPAGSAAVGGEAADGGPSAEDRAAIAALPEGEQQERIRSMVEGLAARLEENPEDVDGWLRLGRSRLVLDEPEAAREAYAKAMELAPDRPEVLKGYASSLLEPSDTPGGDPKVNGDAAGVYQRLLTLTPEDPEPYWLLGLAAAQQGDEAGAIAQWRTLLARLDPESEDHRTVSARIRALEGGEPAARTAAGGADRPGPTPEAMAEMAAPPEGQQQERIRTMVEGLAARLEEDPNDPDGWLMLAKSKQVLGEEAAAKEAYRRAAEVAPDSPEVLKSYAASLLGEAHPETSVATVSDEAEQVYNDVLKLEPNDPEALWYLGLAAVQEGALDEAKSRWQQVLAALGPDHPNYAAVQASLKQVEDDATRLGAPATQ
jgi:cytochrome c-type biogenesis protein CcmH